MWNNVNDERIVITTLLFLRLFSFLIVRYVFIIAFTNIQ